jgi:hypothetical protein
MKILIRASILLTLILSVVIIVIRAQERIYDFYDHGDVRIERSAAGGQTLAPGQIFIDPTQIHTACVVKVGFTSYCFAFDGEWVSLNGAPFVQLVASVPPVLSVNGKTGVVVLTATAPVIQ